MGTAEEVATDPGNGTGKKLRLTPERRKEIAKKAAEGRWAKKKAKEPKPVEPEAIPEPPPVPAEPTPTELGRRRAAKRQAVPPVFGKALAAAEREYAKDLEELAYHEEMAARLKARIPQLVQTIRALGGTMNGVAEVNGNMAVQAGNVVAMPMGDELPPIPVARGAAMAPPDGFSGPVDEEDQFLRAGGGWG